MANIPAVDYLSADRHCFVDHGPGLPQRDQTSEQARDEAWNSSLRDRDLRALSSLDINHYWLPDRKDRARPLGLEL